MRSLACLGTCVGLIIFGTAGAHADAPTPVKTTAITATTWRSTVDVSAQVDAEQSATLAAERPGRVTAVLFQSGETVAAGTLLVKLDDAAELAQLDVDTAKMTEALDTLARSKKLLSINGASEATLEQAQADAAEDRAQLAADRATLAQLNITAPFAGIIGIRKISAGDYINQGQEVAQITQPAPLRVLFSVPQTEAGGISVGEPFTLAASAIPGSPVTAAGTITALSPAVNTQTNARDGEGIITTGASGLLPGMFGTVTLKTGTPEPALEVPDTALNDSVLGRYVFTLKSDGAAYTLHTVYVTEYGQDGTNAIIAPTGLAAGQQIVALGGFNLTDGAAVAPQP